MNEDGAVPEEASVLRSILDYLRTEVIPPDAAGRLGADTDLIGTGLIDSLSIFKLINFIEGAHGVSVLPEDIVVENFGTPRQMAAMVLRKLRAAS